MPSAASYKRRYVGGRESMAYVLYDSAKTFNINDYRVRFVTDVLKLDMGWNSMIGLVNGVWDILNDGILGTLVDKTRTRWGKFRPYLFLHATLGTLLSCLFWVTPLLFGKDEKSIPKAVFWLLLSMMMEAVGTVQDTAETGLISCISPTRTTGCACIPWRR